MTRSQILHDEAERFGWRPIESRHGWARTGPDGTTRAIVEETEDGYTAQVVDASDAEDSDDPSRVRRQWGPEVFQSPADAIDAAETHLIEAAGPAGGPRER